MSETSRSQTFKVPSRRPGRFIVVEGIDGAGTTTQARHVAERLRGLGKDVIATFEPSEGPVGVMIRAALEGRGRGFDWATLALLFAADRLDHLAANVQPHILSGTWVISDRYTLSSLVYQSVTAPPEVPDALEWVRGLNRSARLPDLTLVLDVPSAVAHERREKRGAPEELFDAASLQERLAQAYARAQQLAPEQRVVHVSGLGAEHEITDRLVAAILAAL
ncbi:MAG TPA: dTMP kinase [Polyangiaceae bacterium]|nr:dTMP kinase [Polyangiaceae bacterium]